MERWNPQPRGYLVEDSPILLRLLNECLTAAGANIVGHSSSAPAAIEEIRVFRPEFVVVDIALLEGNGFDVLHAIANEDGGHRPVRLVLTNYALPMYREAAKRLGVEYFFDKSSEITKLIKVVTSMARSSEHSRTSVK